MTTPTRTATDGEPVGEPTRNPVRRFFSALGPGLITGAADDDPSGVATYSVAGARLGTSLLWTAALTWPLMAVVQMTCARIGMVTGQGLAGAMRKKFPKWLLVIFAVGLLAANTINIAADLAGMADAAEMLTGADSHWFVVLFGVAIATATVRLRYYQIAGVLKWLALVLFAYVITAFLVHPDWTSVAKATLVPTAPAGREWWAALVAILGTTISPYLFFWQASQECEELRAVKEDEPLRKAPQQGSRQIRRMTIDTVIGMGFSNLIAFFIMLTAAATLHEHGLTNVESSVQAAEALRPIAGKFAFLLFSMGIVGTGLLAIPVLAGSSAFAMAETFRWRRGLDLSPLTGARFYLVIAASTLAGVGMGLTHLDPIRALYWAAVLNGVVSAPIMGLLMLMAANPQVMGTFVIGARLKVLGWLATIAMAVAVVCMFALDA